MDESYIKMPQIIYDFNIMTGTVNLQRRIELPTYDVWSRNPSRCLMNLEIRSWGRFWYSTRTSWGELIWSHSSLLRSVTQTTAAGNVNETVTEPRPLLSKWVYLSYRNINRSLPMSLARGLCVVFPVVWTQPTEPSRLLCYDSCFCGLPSNTPSK